MIRQFDQFSLSGGRCSTISDSAQEDRRGRGTGGGFPNIARLLGGQLNPIAFINHDTEEQETDNPFLEMKEAFDAIDEDHDSLISSDDLTKFMKSVGMFSTNEEVHELMLEFDTDGDGYLTFDDFLKVMNEDLYKDDSTGEIVREAFRQFDADGSGYISLKNLKTVLQQLGESQLTMQEMLEVIADFQIPHDGSLNYEHFLSRVTEFSGKNKSRGTLEH